MSIFLPVLVILFTATSFAVTIEEYLEETPFECPKCVEVVKPSEVSKNPKLITEKLEYGCTVKLVRGTYILKDHIRFPGVQDRHQCLLGAGSGSDGSRLVVKTSNSEKAEDGVIRLVKDHEVTMKDFSLDITDCGSKKLCKYAIKAKKVSNVLIDNVKLRGVFAKNAEFVYLHKVSLSNAQRNCLNIKNSHHIVVESSSAYDCGYHGFSFERGDNLHLHDSSAKDIGNRVLRRNGRKEQLHGAGAHFKKNGPDTYVHKFKVKNAYFGGIWIKKSCVYVWKLKVTGYNSRPCIRLSNKAKISYEDISCKNSKVFKVDGKKLKKATNTEYCQ